MSSSSTSNPANQFGPNEWLVEEMYQRFLDDPESVDPAWHEFFVDYRRSDGDADEPDGASEDGRGPEDGNGADGATDEGSGAQDSGGGAGTDTASDDTPTEHRHRGRPHRGR